MKIDNDWSFLENNYSSPDLLEIKNSTEYSAKSFPDRVLCEPESGQSKIGRYSEGETLLQRQQRIQNAEAKLLEVYSKPLVEAFDTYGGGKARNIVVRTIYKIYKHISEHITKLLKIEEEINNIIKSENKEGNTEKKSDQNKSDDGKSIRERDERIDGDQLGGGKEQNIDNSCCC